MIGELLLAGAQQGVKLFGMVVVFISLAAALFVLLFIAVYKIIGEDKDKKKG